MFREINVQILGIKKLILVKLCFYSKIVLTEVKLVVVWQNLNTIDLERGKKLVDYEAVTWHGVKAEG